MGEKRPADERQLWQAAVHRVGQFWQGLTAQVTPTEFATAERLLGPRGMILFHQMPTDAQRHSLNVLAAVWQGDDTPLDLAQAALLHDVGKCASAEVGFPLTLWVRGPLVLMDTFFPTLITRWASDDPSHGWRYLLYVHRDHPALGAEMAAQAGCSERCCWLIEHHQVDPDALAEMISDAASDDGRLLLLTVLQAADGSD